MKSQEVIKEELVRHLKGGEAFFQLEEMLKKIPFSDLGIKPAGLPYSFFEIFSHIRLTQKDILNYCQQSSYKAPDWPDDYWPQNSFPESELQWEELQDSYFTERKALVAYLFKDNTGLVDKVPSSKKHSILREVLLVIEHTAYHTGQLMILLRLLGHHSS